MDLRRMLREMRGAVQKEMDVKAFSLRLYPLCQDCRKMAKTEGGCDIAKPKRCYIA